MKTLQFLPSAPCCSTPKCKCSLSSSFQLCEHSTEGYHCEKCKKGFYGDATRGTPYDCTPCPCP